MIDESYAEEIPNFALEKISAAPERRQRFDGRIVFRHRHTHAQPLAPAPGDHLIHDFEARLLLAPIIDRRNVREKIVVELCVFLQKAKTFAQVGAVQNHDIISLRLHDLKQLGTETLLDVGQMGALRHARLIPVQGPFLPDVNVTDCEDDEKNTHLHQTEDPQLAEINRPRIEKYHFQIEDKK